MIFQQSNIYWTFSIVWLNLIIHSTVYCFLATNSPDPDANKYSWNISDQLLLGNAFRIVNNTNFSWNSILNFEKNNSIVLMTNTFHHIPSETLMCLFAKEMSFKPVLYINSNPKSTKVWNSVVVWNIVNKICYRLNDISNNFCFYLLFGWNA